LKPTGTFVVFLGPDGTGKSTISRAVEESLARVYRHVWHFHWRPGLIPKLSKKRETSIELGIGAHPPRESKYGAIVSVLRYIYYLVDFTLGYWLIVYWKKAQTTLVIGERWYHDVIANPARYGFCLPRWILKFCGYVVPKPDRIFQISADPALIHQRKDELTVEEIAEQILLYRGLLPDAPRGIEIVNQGTLDDSVQLICDSILNLLVDNTAKKMAIDGK